MVAGPNEAAYVGALAGEGLSLMRRRRRKRSVLDLSMGKGSYVYTFGAEVVEIWFSLGAWVLLPRVLAGAVVTSWSLDH